MEATINKSNYPGLSDKQLALIREATPYISRASLREKMRANVIIMFNNQKLLNFWHNFMEGQISDGKWENCSNTEWLWKNTLTMLGDKNEIKVSSSYIVGKKVYGWDKTFESLIDDGTCPEWITESGFKDKAEFKNAFKTVAEMIKNPVTDYDFINLLNNTANTELNRIVAEKFNELLEHGFEVEMSNGKPTGTCFKVVTPSKTDDLRPYSNLSAYIDKYSIKNSNSQNFIVEFNKTYNSKEFYNPFENHVFRCSTIEEVEKVCEIVGETVEKFSQIFCK